MKTWLVLGGGNGGHATAAHLAIMGHKVRIHDISEKTIETINNNGGIEAQGVVEGLGKLEFATTDLEKAVNGADNIIITVPSFAHGAIAKNLAPLLKTGQKVLLHPSTMFGAIVFSQEMKKCGNNAEIIFGETVSLLYAARLAKVGVVKILGIKDSLPYAVFPSMHTEDFIADFQEAFPQINDARENIISSALENIGFVVHPLPTLLNTGLVESDRDWLYYYDGITPSVGKAMEKLDEERVEISGKVGQRLSSSADVYRNVYKVEGENLYELIHQVKAYEGIAGHHEMSSRYLTEEVPFALMPVLSLAEKAQVEAPIMKATVVYAEAILGKELNKNSRTLETLGLESYSLESILEYVKTGKL